MAVPDVVLFLLFMIWCSFRTRTYSLREATAQRRFGKEIAPNALVLFHWLYEPQFAASHLLREEWEANW
jgi:hypothetical protein